MASINCKNLFNYVENNPVTSKDSTGAFAETVFDVISLGSSILEVCTNPYSAGAWISLGCDVIDTAVPFVTGLGEASKGIRGAVKMMDNADEVVDAAASTAKIAGKTSSKTVTEVIMPSKPHTNGTKGHWETILDEVNTMKNSGDYSKIYVNKGLSNEIPGAKPNRRPDIMGVRTNGRIDQVEVPSKTDNLATLIQRMQDNQRILGDRAGNIRIKGIGGN